MAEAWLNYSEFKLFAIYDNNQIIGFVSMYLGEEHYQIINFLIDDEVQGRGYGTLSAKSCLGYFKNNFNAEVVSLPVHIEYRKAISFWQKVGFEFSDNIEDDYVFMRRKL